MLFLQWRQRMMILKKHYLIAIIMIKMIIVYPIGLYVNRAFFLILTIFSSFRHRQTDKRSQRFCFCCIFLIALSIATIIVLFSSYIFHTKSFKNSIENVQIELLWTSAFPKLITETAFRLVDCNSDGILDVIFGFGTGVDTLDDNRLLCDLYFNGIHPCNGGVKVRKRESRAFP